MARPLRLIVPGLPHHLIQRGHNRAPVFLDDADRQLYLDALRHVAKEQGVAIHAYVLMDNHVHLLCTPIDEPGLSKMVQALGRRYVSAFNLRHGRSGTLWEGRYRAHPVQTDTHFLACQRYIELNPQRAGLASGLLDHPWSSLMHHLGACNDPLVTDHPCFWGLGNTPFEREASYRQWLSDGVPESEMRRISLGIQRGAVFGDEAFVAQLARQLERDLTLRPRGRPRKAAA